ncbi:hypothetical protein Hanom_Chr02g00171071 [Helianthus anomalus]
MVCDENLRLCACVQRDLVESNRQLNSATVFESSHRHKHARIEGLHASLPYSYLVIVF